MKIFIDTANIEQIKKWNDLGLVDGVTTNPSLVAKEGRDFKELVKEIAERARENALAPALASQFGSFSGSFELTQDLSLLRPKPQSVPEA